MTELLTSDEEAAAARAAEQARQRKARREAKIKAGAENRLNRITGLGGGVPRGGLTPNNFCRDTLSNRQLTIPLFPRPRASPGSLEDGNGDDNTKRSSQYRCRPTCRPR